MNTSKLLRMKIVTKCLQEAARIAWDRGRLIEAASLYQRSDIAESRARDFQLHGIAQELGKPFIVHSFNGGAHLFDIGRPML